MNYKNRRAYKESAEKEIFFSDMFETLCTYMIGSGASRDVYECGIRDDVVVKVHQRKFETVNQNEREWFIWNNVKDTKWAKYFAPCLSCSDNNHFLIQKKCEPINSKTLPTKLPSILDDRALWNWGLLDGKVVCIDYGITLIDLPKSLFVIEDWIYKQTQTKVK